MESVTATEYSKQVSSNIWRILFVVDMANIEQSQISCSLYAAIDDTIGTKEQVQIRRTVTNLRDDVLKRERIFNKFRQHSIF